VLVSERLYGTAGHVAHEQRLEDRPPESEAQDILDDHLACPGEAEDTGEHRAREDAHAVAGDAVDRRSQNLSPTHRNVALVQSWQRFTTAEHIEEGAEDTSVSGRQHEPPFEHRRLWCRADVDRHE